MHPSLFSAMPQGDNKPEIELTCFISGLNIWRYDLYCNYCKLLQRLYPSSLIAIPVG